MPDLETMHFPPPWRVPERPHELCGFLTTLLFRTLEPHQHPFVKVSWYPDPSPERSHVLHYKVRVHRDAHFPSESEDEYKAYRVLVGKEGETYRALQRVFGMIARVYGYLIVLEVRKDTTPLLPR